MLNLLDYEKHLDNVLKMDNTALICKNKSNDLIICTNRESVCNVPINAKVVRSEHQGGTVVAFPGDTTFTWVSEKRLLNDILDDICKYLHDREICTYIDNNDVMYEGKKLFGTMSYELNDKYYEGMFLSYNSDVLVIQKICTKAMIKQPISIPKHIDTNKLDDLCVLLCNKYGLTIYGGDN